MQITTLLLAGMIGAAAAVPVQAQDADAARSAILQGANLGDRITVTLKDGSRMRGRLLDVKDAVVLRHDDDQRTFSFADIDKVSRYKNGMILGPVIGTAAGLAIGLPVRRRLNNEGQNGDGALTVLVITGVTAGTLLDALIGSERTLYRRPASTTSLSIAPTRSGFTAQLRTTW
jgi:hypothetical protein